VGLFAIKLVDG